MNPLVGDAYEFARRNRTLPLGLPGVAGALRRQRGLARSARAARHAAARLVSQPQEERPTA